MERVRSQKKTVVQSEPSVLAQVVAQTHPSWKTKPKPKVVPDPAEPEMFNDDGYGAFELAFMAGDVPVHMRCKKSDNSETCLYYAGVIFIAVVCISPTQISMRFRDMLALAYPNLDKVHATITKALHKRTDKK